MSATTMLRVCLQRRDISDVELLDDLRAVAQKLNIRRLSATVYQNHGRFCHDTFRNRFGSWTRAVTLARLQPGHSPAVSADAILRDIASVAGELKSARLNIRQYKKHGRYSWRMVYRRFGNWQTAGAAAGIAPGKAIPQNDRVLLENLRDLWLTLARQPRLADLALPLSRFSIEPCRTRFGSFNKALLALDRFLHPRTKARDAVVNRPGVNRRKTARQIGHRLRYRILCRDHFRCCACGRSPATHAGVMLQIDHVIPWRKGGETVAENLQALCGECNSGKGDLSPERRRTRRSRRI